MSATDATLIVGMFAIFSSLMGVFLPMTLSQRNTNRKLAETKEAITNNHQTHLRDDLDAVAKDLKDVAREVREVRRTQGEYKMTLERHLDDSAEFTESTIRRLRRIENGDSPSPAKL